MKIRKFFISTVIAAAVTAGLCGGGSNTIAGASLFRGTDGTGTGNTGFYGDYTYGAGRRDTSGKAVKDRKNLTDTIDNSDSSSNMKSTSERQTKGLGNSGDAYIYGADGNVMRTDLTAGNTVTP